STDTRNNSTIVAGIDIGSNSIRLLISSVKDYKIENIIYQEKATARLASNINKTGRLDVSRIDAAIEALKSFKKAIDKYKVDKVKAVATSAIREAENGGDFIQKALEAGIKVDIISGIEEGIMEYNGVKAGLEIDDSVLITDVGGGSTEIIRLNDDKTIHAESYKIGVVKTADMFDFKNNAVKSIELCKDYVKNFFSPQNIIKNPNMFIATAGTATTLAAIDMDMTRYDWTKINGYKMNIDKIENIMLRIANTDYDKRILINGMDKGREDLILPGIIIILEIMRKADVKIMTVSDFGLREGVVVTAAYS
ncbi:MAG: hypothetical protein K2N67_08225, partial [Mucispirillum sp.]|nr:hypothetical protein [Mucispirillum sp.]